MNEEKKHDGGPAMESTLRDYFAAMVLQGLIAHHGANTAMTAAREAYGYADEMLKARQRIVRKEGETQ